jgi:hypothetical protein
MKRRRLNRRVTRRKSQPDKPLLPSNPLRSRRPWKSPVATSLTAIQHMLALFDLVVEESRKVDWEKFEAELDSLSGENATVDNSP